MSSSVPATLTPSSDQLFEERWAAWQERGVVRERAGRQRSIAVALAVGAIALAATVVYNLLAA